MELDKIYNMDCLEGMKHIPDNYIDMIVTSPPYNFCLRVHGGKYTYIGGGETRNGSMQNKYTNGLRDAMTMERYFEWQKDCITEMLRICKGVVFYNIQLITGNKRAIFWLMNEFAGNIIDVLIWDKKSAEPAVKEGCLNSEFEFIFALSNEDNKGRIFKQAIFDRGTMSNVIRIGKNAGGSNNHRASFPLSLPQTLIRNFSGDIVFDPFMGSGTTAIAAIKEKRHFIGFELDKGYYNKACERIKAEQAQPTLF